ncbi:UNVERIFIED_CONTAM: hypothetical protein Sradi_1524600 [Sesamum radiatum]|uniref:Uncharacterized protein n=1 Tax=Sesamum radiatum TaxID=300843 RepID=A0AAW2U7Q5_SESRA
MPTGLPGPEDLPCEITFAHQVGIERAIIHILSFGAARSKSRTHQKIGGSPETHLLRKYPEVEKLAFVLIITTHRMIQWVVDLGGYDISY